MVTYLGKATYIMKSESTFIEGMGDWFYIMDKGGAMLVKVPMTHAQAYATQKELALDFISPAQYMNLVTESDKESKQ